MAKYLSAAYANGVRIHGIILLHPISDNRMTSSSRQSIQMIKAICGFTQYTNLAIATTKWPYSTGGDRLDFDSGQWAELHHREAEMAEDDRFFGDFVPRGATIFRHNERGVRSGTREERLSAFRIVDHLVTASERHPSPVLRLQREMIDEGKTLGETEAGATILGGELRRVREESETQLSELRRELQSSAVKKDVAYSGELRRLRADAVMRLQKIENDHQTLDRSMEQLHEREQKLWQERIVQAQKQFYARLVAKEQELLDMEMSLQTIREEMALHPKTKQTAKETQEYERMVDETRQGVAEAQSAYSSTFEEPKTSNRAMIANEVASGMTAGAVSAVVSACEYLDSPSILIAALKTTY